MGSGVYRSEGCPGNGKASPGQRGGQSLAVAATAGQTFGVSFSACIGQPHVMTCADSHTIRTAGLRVHVSSVNG